jgi:hypothetical protein
VQRKSYFWQRLNQDAYRGGEMASQLLFPASPCQPTSQPLPLNSPPGVYRMWWKVPPFLGFFSALLVLLPADVLAQKANTTPTPATPQDYAQLKNMKQINGSVFYLDTSSNTLTLRVTIPQMQRNPNYRPPRINPNGNNYNRYHSNYHHMNRGSNPQSQMSHMMSRYQQIMRERNPIQREQQMMQLSMQMQQMEMQAMMQMEMQAQRVQVQQAMQMQRVMQQVARANSNPNNQPFKIVTTQKDFELDLQDNVPVRKTYVGVEFDDMGNAKKYTKAELAELRGKDTSKPGYTAKLEDVQPGQEVVLYLAPPKKKAAKSDDADLAPAVKASNPTRSSIRMIVMTKELTAAAAANVAVKGKKKK